MSSLEILLVVLGLSTLLALEWFYGAHRYFYKKRALEDGERIVFNPKYIVSEKGRKRSQQAREDFLKYYGEQRLKRILFWFVLIPLTASVLFLVAITLNGGQLFGFTVRLD